MHHGRDIGAHTRIMPVCYTGYNEHDGLERSFRYARSPMRETR